MIIVALAIGLALGIQAFVVKPYQIPSESMEPTLDVGQRVLVNRVFTRLGADPKPGDIVVFHPPEGAVNGNDCGAPKDPGQPCATPTTEEAEEAPEAGETEEASAPEEAEDEAPAEPGDSDEDSAA